MRIGRTIPTILLCALLTSCTISRRGSSPETEEHTLPAESGEVIVSDEEEDVPIPDDNGGVLPGGYESLSYGDGYWKEFTPADGEGLFDSGFAEELSEDAATYYADLLISERSRMTDIFGEEEAERIMSELVECSVSSVLAAPSENGTFVYKTYFISFFSYDLYELYFIPDGGEPVLISGIDQEISYGGIVGGSYLFWFDAFDGVLHRMSEDGLLELLALPLDETYSYSYCTTEPAGAEKLTVRVRNERSEENGAKYTKNEVYTIDTEKLEIAGSYKEEEHPVYQWIYYSNFVSKPYDPEFEYSVSEAAQSYFDSEKEKYSASAGEDEWGRVVATVSAYDAYGGAFVTKLYSLWDAPELEPRFIEIYFFRAAGRDEEGKELYDAVLLHSMSNTEDKGDLRFTGCDGFHCYFTYNGAFCRVSADGTLEKVLQIDRYFGWELDRSSSDITGSENLLNVRLCYRSTPELIFSSSDNPYLEGFELGAPLQRTDTCVINADTLEVTSYTAGAITPDQSEDAESWFGIVTPHTAEAAADYQ